MHGTFWTILQSPRLTNRCLPGVQSKWIPFLPAIVAFSSGHALDTGAITLSELAFVVECSKLDPATVLAKARQLGRTQEPLNTSDPLVALALVVGAFLHFLQTANVNDIHNSVLDAQLSRLPVEQLRLLVPQVSLLCLDRLDAPTILRCLVLGMKEPGECVLALMRNVPYAISQFLDIAVDVVGSLPVLSKRVETTLRHCFGNIGRKQDLEVLALSLASARMLGGLFLETCVKWEEDPCDFLNAAFQRPSASWITSFLGPDTKAMALQLQERIVAKLHSHLEDVESRQVMIASCLRALCGCVGILGCALSPEQAETCIVTVRLCRNEAVIRYALCLAVLACGSFGQERLADLVGRLLASDLSDQPMLFAVLLRSKQFGRVRDLLQSILSMPASVSDSTLQAAGNAFASQITVFGEIALRAIGPVASRTDAVAIQSSMDLIYAVCNAPINFFVTNTAVSLLQDWTFRAVSRSTSPISIFLPDIVLQAAKKAAMFPEPTKIPYQTLLPILQVGRIYNADRILLLLYVLAYQDQLLFGEGTNPAAEDYPVSLWENIPTKELWLASASSSDLTLRDKVYPELTGLLAKLKPQLLDPQVLLQSHLESGDHFVWSGDVQILLSRIRQSEADSAKVVDALRGLDALPMTELASQWNQILGVVLPLAIASSEIAVLAEIESLWHSLAMRLNEKFLLATVNSLRGPGSRPFEQADLAANPLLLFHVDNVVFTKPQLVRIFLTLVTAFVNSSRSSFDALFRLNSKRKATPIENTHISAFLKLQDLAIIQSLLKACLEAGDDSAGARKLVFAYIHQHLIEQPEYIRIILFEGFDPKLIESTIDGIPALREFVKRKRWVFPSNRQPDASMFPTDVAFDYSAQLVNTTFGLQFLAHLTAKYPMQRSLDVTRGVLLPRIRGILSGGAAISSAALALNPDRSLPPVPRDVLSVARSCMVLVKTFPELADPIATILREAVPDVDHVARKVDGATLDQWLTVADVLKNALEAVTNPANPDGMAITV